MLRIHSLILLVTTVLLLAVACDGGQDPASAEPVEGTTIAVQDNRFDPPNLHVRTGDTVTWTWEGSASHDVSGDGFASEVQTAGTFAHTFVAAGTYEYVCTLHSGMRGQVVVEDA